MGVRIIGVIGLSILLTGTGAAQVRPIPGARLAFPNTGEVSALILFVQHADVPDGAGSYGDDPVTEWPHTHSLEPSHPLPAWARDGRLIAAPGTPPDAFDEGSISAFYHLMSNGRFRLTGYVYPQVIIPEHPVDWYHEQRGAFPSGAVKRSHEILTSPALQAYLSENPDALDLAALDTFRNGTAEHGADGLFDLVILIDRNVTLPGLRRDRTGKPLGGSGITSLGADTEIRPSHLIDFRDPATDAFAPELVMLNGMRVVDNLTSGSGILINALTRKQAVRAIAHEIGHRHFGFYHTCQNPLSPDSDCLSIMGGAYLTMSAGDRIKLGWTDVIPVDVPALGRTLLTIPDALPSGTVFRLRSGGADRCGDVIVEARLWSNFWDSPPDPGRPDAPFAGNDDADDNDLFLPQEGLYLYKAPEAGNHHCGGNQDPRYDEQRYSSLENSGLHIRLAPFREGLAETHRAFRMGGTYRVAYRPGDTYAPFARPRFFFHQHPGLDNKLTLTNITRQDNAFTVELWTDNLVGWPDTGAATLAMYPDPTAGYTTVRFEVPQQSDVVLTVHDVLGRRLHTLAEGLHQPGVHELLFEATHLPAGTYWVRMQYHHQATTASFRVVQ